MDVKAVGERIRQQRKLKGLTQAELAAKAELAVMSIRRYESGERIAPEGVRQRIADALGISISDLTGEAETFQPFTATDDLLIKLGGFPAISEFYNLPEEAQKRALEDLRGFAEFVVAKYKKESEDK